jgi:hypothetical protein
MPDSLEKTLKLLIKAGILPKKKKRKNKKYTRVSKRQILENIVRQNSNNPISYGQPNLSHLSANNQMAFTENRNKQIDYENNFNDFLNPHIKRINDKIFDTNNSFNEKLVNINNSLNDRITDTNKSLDGTIYYSNDLYKEVKNQFNRIDTRFDNIISKDNIDEVETKGSDEFHRQGITHDPNGFTDNIDNNNYLTPQLNLNVKKPPLFLTQNLASKNINNIYSSDDYNDDEYETPNFQTKIKPSPLNKKSVKSTISNFIGYSKKQEPKIISTPIIKPTQPTQPIIEPIIINTPIKNNISKSNFDKLNLDEDDNLDNWVNSKGNKRGIGLIKKNLEKRRKEKEYNNIKKYDEKEDDD